MQTRRYPRTIEEAFGPYARGPIHEPPEPMSRADRIVIYGCAIAGFALVGFMIAGWV
jgi:hypothetical protein